MHTAKAVMPELTSHTTLQPSIAFVTGSLFWIGKKALASENPQPETSSPSSHTEVAVWPTRMSETV